MSSEVIVEPGLDGPIENFSFRQCPAEFKLKISDETPAWNKSKIVPKNSLLQISHSKGIIMFPHTDKGALGFAAIHELAEKDAFNGEFLAFPGDDSFIVSLCMDPLERFLFVAKESNKLYSIDLAVEDVSNANSSDKSKRPFISKIVQLESSIVHVSCSKDFGLWVLCESGKVSNFTSPQLQEGKFEIPVSTPIGCFSEIKENVMALGSQDSSKIFLTYFESNDKIEIEEISVPFEELNCGSIGISSVFLLPNGNSLLFSCISDDETAEDIPLLLLENILNSDGEDLKFSFYFDPCASRPPRKNQFYFLNAGNWSDNLADFVVLSNYASPDIGICGRTGNDESFESYFIDDDEGLAQLPMVNGELTYPVGMALDFSSSIPIQNLTDPDTEPFPPAPILWILTDSGHLCPFSMLKTDLKKPLSFMKSVPGVKFEVSKEIEAPKTPITLDTSNASTALNTTNISNELNTLNTLPSTPQTPSKVPIQQLASLQKSTDIKPIESPISAFSFKPAPIVTETKVEASKPVPKVLQEPEAPPLIKKEEKMETLKVDMYQNILLTEIAATHASMQDDLFTLKQLSLKNSLLIRQNSQKYFNSLASLEAYALSLEKLLKSSEGVFFAIKGKVEILKHSLSELNGKAFQVKSNWNRIKQDYKIDWNSRVKNLASISADLFDRIDRLRNFLSNPSEVTKYRATLESFVDSAQEKVQHLMAHLSGLFVTSKNEDISGLFADLGALNLNSSSDDLLQQLTGLNLASEDHHHHHQKNSKKSENLNKSLLSAVKSRGARLLIPSRITPPVAVVSRTETALKLTAEDESLINSFLSAIKLTENVPDFAETAILSKLSLNDDRSEKSTEPAVKTLSETKSSFESKPLDNKAPFSFNKPETKVEDLKKVEQPKLSEPKAVVFEPKPSFVTEPKLLVDYKPKVSDESKPSFSFASTTAPVTESKPTTSSPSFSFKQPSSSVNDSPAPSVPKIPSIFTTSVPQTIPLVKNESPLPTFDSLGFGAAPKTTTTGSEPQRPFPSIFGVKPNDVNGEKFVEKEKIMENNEKSTFEAKIEPQPPATTTQPQPQTFSFSFAPSNAATSTATSPAPFSITSKPTFSSVPTFGSTSLPSAPAFGQTSLPTAKLGPASASETIITGTGGFAAFAAASSSSNNAGFSAFAPAPTYTNNNDNNASLTFASFLPADKKQQSFPNNDTNSSSSKPSSSFSFSGFRG